MKNGAHRHRKVKRLARILEIPLTYAVGLVEALYQATAEHAVRGDIGCLDDDEISEELGWVEWPGNVVAVCNESFVAALADAGLIDRDATHRYLTHGWKRHAPDFIRRRIERRQCGWAEDDNPAISLDNDAPTETQGESRVGQCPDNVGQRRTTSR